MTKEHGDGIKHLEKLVTALYDFRDGYFRKNWTKDPSEKWKYVETELKKILGVFAGSEKAVAKERAKYFYLLGKALNVTESYNPEAEEVLTRAIKLDVKLYEAWNALGETYCKKKDVDQAKKCFLSALQQKNNSDSLRNLSMLMGTEELRDVAAAMKYAKQAVQLDAKDGKSWLVLGNAYTSLYAVKQDRKILKMCKCAYEIAKRDDRLASDPFLHFNMAIIEKYQNDYEAALSSFEKAQLLEPTWRQPQIEKQKILHYLERAHTLAQDKGKLKRNKLKKFIRGINPRIHLGKNSNRKQVYFKDLKKNGNKGKVVLGVVAATFPEDSTYNITLVDAQQTSAIVNLCNFPQHKRIMVGSIIAIPDPLFTTIQITANGNNYLFDSIRVESSASVTINGKSILSH